MYGTGRERWQTDGQVLGSITAWRAVAHPLARFGNKCLTGGHNEEAAIVINPQFTAKYYIDLAKLGCLAGFRPTCR